MKTPRFLEYIEADGQQYIDTAVQITGTADIYMEARITAPSTNWDTFFGMRKGDGYRCTMRFGNTTNGNLQVQFSTSNNPAGSHSAWNTNLRKDTAIAGYVSCFLYGTTEWLDGDPAMANISYVTTEGERKIVQESKTFYRGGMFTFPQTLYLCACHDYDQGAIDFAHMQLKRCRIHGYARAKKDGSDYLIPCLVRDFFPALDGDGRACLYDAVSDSYFYSKTETDFIAGPTVSKTLFRVWQQRPGFSPEYFIQNVLDITVPRAEYFASKPFDHPSDPQGYKYEFVGFDTDPAGFTAVYPTDDYAEHGTPLPATLKDTVSDVYAVWKRIWGFLCKDINGVFYGQNDDGSRRDLGLHDLTAQVFRDYAFDDYPTGDMLTDLESPSIMYWTKEGYKDDEGQQHYFSPRSFEATLTGVPPLPQLVTYPTLTLRKPLDCVTIPAHEETLWNVSFDGGESWYKYDNGWVAVTEEGDGCHKRRLELRDSDDWAAVCVNGTIRFRAWLWKGTWVAAIRADYVEGGNT